MEGTEITVSRSPEAKEGLFLLPCRYAGERSSGWTETRHNGLQPWPASLLTVTDVSQTHTPLYAHEEKVLGDADYINVGKRDEMKSRSIMWRVAEKRVEIKAMEDGLPKDSDTALERTRMHIGALFEHLFNRIAYGPMKRSAASLWSIQ
jgi:hypothetical protein